MISVTRMNAAQMCDYLAMPVDATQLRAMRILEGFGKQFLVHFGVDNAVEKAECAFLESVVPKRVM